MRPQKTLCHNACDTEDASEHVDNDNENYNIDDDDDDDDDAGGCMHGLMAETTSKANH